MRVDFVMTLLDYEMVSSRMAYVRGHGMVLPLVPPHDSLVLEDVSSP